MNLILSDFAAMLYYAGVVLHLMVDIMPGDLD